MEQWQVVGINACSAVMDVLLVWFFLTLLG